MAGSAKNRVIEGDALHGHFKKLETWHSRSKYVWCQGQFLSYSAPRKCPESLAY